MKKAILFLILILVGGLIWLGLYFSGEKDFNNKLGTGDEIGEKEVITEEDIPDDPLFDYEEDNNFNLSENDNKPNESIRAVYLTSYSASSDEKINFFIDKISETDINAVVIDVNNFSGKLAYDSEIPVVNEYNLDSNRIENVNSLVDRFHENDIYVIARMVVFQNTALAKARPDFALRSKSSSTLWYDDAGQAWLDPDSKDIWRYLVEVSREVLSLGFDEVNYDYIRFPSDGDLEDIEYPVWDKNSLKTDVLLGFFNHLRNKLENQTISIDIFGLSTVNRNGLGIGQLIENTYDHFDIVSPMVYPSHYADGSFGISDPASSPYEIILVSLVNSVLRVPEIERIEDYKDGKRGVEVRPWIQDFNLGADYGPDKIRAQIGAVKEVLGDSAGYMIWNPRNVYTWEAL